MATPSLVQPPAAAEIAADLLRAATGVLDAPSPPGLGKAALAKADLLRLGRAHAYARAVDWTAFEWFWAQAGREWEWRHDKSTHVPRGSSKGVGAPKASVKREVAKRDGYRCRYCGLRVVTSPAMTALERLLPAALPFSDKGPTAVTCHPMQCVLRLTWDHIEPFAGGGTNDVDNLVTSCGACNFNKGDCTLEELGLIDPRVRPPVVDDWDGLDGRLDTKAL